MSSQELKMFSRKQRDTQGNENNKKQKRKLFYKGIPVFADGGFDVIFLILVFSLLTIGLVMMFSASYVSAKYDPDAGYDPYFYIRKQLGFAIVGIIAMFVASKINIQIYRHFTPIFAALCFFLLVAVLFFHTKNADGFKRWLLIPIVNISFQPSDVAKLGIIMFYAWGLEKYKKQLETKWWVAVIAFAVMGMLCMLIYLEHHLSCTVLVLLIIVGMLYLGGLDRRWFILGLILGAIGLFVIVNFRNQLLDPYQAERIDSFIHKDYTDTDTRWQTNQSLFALGSGGFFGLGLGNSRQKHLYMPEPQNDFIFAIVGEELGFLRCVLILVLFALLIWRGFVIATRTKTAYGRMVALGISLQVGIQTIFNILVVTDMVPNTGISLPFFSSGGTALLILLAEMGVVLSASRTGEKKA